MPWLSNKSKDINSIISSLKKKTKKKTGIPNRGMHGSTLIKRITFGNESIS